MLQEQFNSTVINFRSKSLQHQANEAFDPNVIYADNALKVQIERLKLLDHQVKVAEKEIAAIKTRIKERMGDATVVANDNGVPMCTWAFDSKGRTLFNDKLLKIEQPTLYAKYAYVSAPSRKFLTK